MEDRARARLRVHLRLIDRDVAPVVERYRAHIECRAGCSDCCHQTFRVSEIEGAYLREGLATLPAATRDDILARARAYVPDARQPCPVLDDDGRCRLYAHRPRICRKYGIPLWHPDRAHEVTTCPKNFRDATDVDADLILDPQAEWARDWIRLRRELELPDSPRATIAEHLLARS
jgi:Fe-S-cluster containining protein